MLREKKPAGEKKTPLHQVLFSTQLLLSNAKDIRSESTRATKMFI
jgi:hypothetical protein